MILQRWCRRTSSFTAVAPVVGATLSSIKGESLKNGALPTIKEQTIKLANGKAVYVSSNLEKHKGTKISFLGTSNFPGVTGSCLLLSHGATRLLFNCGENVYREIQRKNYVHQGCIIFIRSMDLSQVVGLPAMLSSAMLREPVVVYGPQGLRQYLRSTLRACFARVPTKYFVHELVLSNTLRVQKRQTEELLHEDELDGDDYVCSEDGFCELINDEQYTVKAGVLCRSTQTWGFIYREKQVLEASASNTSIAIVAGALPELFLRGVQSVDVLIHDMKNQCSEADFSQVLDAQCQVVTGCKPKSSKKRIIAAQDYMIITVFFEH